MSDRCVGIEKGLGPEGRIAVVRLDRGDAINALSPAAMRQLRAAARVAAFLERRKPRFRGR
jgi:enoyl-CoA hydratase